MVEKKQEGGDLKSVFLLFTAQKAEMDTKQLVKFCKATKLLDSKLSNKLIMTKFADYSGGKDKNLTYETFQMFLVEAGKVKGVSTDEINETVLANGIPLLSGTKSGI